MNKLVNPELTDDENPEWTDEIFAVARRGTATSKMGRPLSDNPKVSTTVRLDVDVLTAFKASGKGWQTRMNAALRDYVRSHPMQ